MAQIMEFIDLVKDKLAEDRTDEVLDDMLEYFKPIDRRFYNNLIGLKGQYNRLEEKKETFQITEEVYNVQRNRLNMALIAQIDRFYDRSKTKKREEPLKAMPARIGMLEDEAKELTMEALIGKSDLNKVSWLAKGLQASKSVCIVARADGATGTGFLF
ncbi:MAG: hypothetical protein KDC44_02130 [Phaeodactylibacter sp.]|nr:hypothetical protein [Phaeodactylibacter sp.]